MTNLNSRRDFLKMAAAAGIGVPTMAMLLQACSTDTAPEGTPTALQIASPDNPVTWPIFDDNQPIADNLPPEQDATLQIYTYSDYLAKQAVSAFEKKFASTGVKVEVSTFNDTDEALQKIRSGKVPYDLYFPSYDQIAKLVNAKLIRPLNQTYVPGITNVWPTFQSPWYDGEWRYSVPFSVYSTGIGWRTDQVSENPGDRANPYDILWDPKYKGKTAVIDDFHTMMSMVLLKNGITDINTANPADIAAMSTSMSELTKATGPKVTITMYNDLPLGQLGLCQMWSGDAINAVYYLPKGEPPTNLGYWFPEDGKGMVDSDLTVALSGGKNPVLSHLFINHLLQPETALQNFKYIGYQYPQVTFEPASFVSQGLVPANLESSIVKESDFDVAYRLLELPVDVQQQWQQVWQKFKAGG